MYWILIIFIIVIAIIFVPLRMHIKYNDISNDLSDIEKNKIEKQSQKSNKKNGKNNKKNNNYFKLYIFYYIPIINIDLDKIRNKKRNNKKNKENKKKNSKTKNDNSNQSYIVDAIFEEMEKLFTNKKKSKNSIKIKDVKNILKSAYFEQFFLKIGINTGNCIINSYAIATFNMLLCMYINRYIYNFDMTKLYYTTYISDEVYKFNIDSILRIKIADNISVILRIINRYLKNIKEAKSIRKKENNRRKVESENGRKASNRKLNDDSNDIFRKYD